MQSMQCRTNYWARHLYRINSLCKQEVGLQLYKLSGHCTDGTPALSGKHTGAVSLIEVVTERCIITHHCIVHQQALCGKILKFDYVMSEVVSVVNYFRARALKHRTF